MKSRTTYKGSFLDLDIAKTIEQDRDRYLRRVGRIGVAEMRRHTTPHSWTGELSDSIAWRTQKDSSPISDAKNLIDPPETDEGIDIGSKCSYAFFREFGAGVHGTKDGSAEFIDRMKDWFRDKIGGNPDGDESFLFWHIVNTIRYGPKAQAGTQNKAPFVMPSLPAIISAARKYAMDVSISKHWGK